MQSVFKDVEYLEKDARKVLEKWTDLPPYNHGLDTWGIGANRVTHPQYNKAMKELLDNFRKALKPGKTLTVEDINKFIRLVETGKGDMTEAFMLANRGSSRRYPSG